MNKRFLDHISVSRAMGTAWGIQLSSVDPRLNLGVFTPEVADARVDLDSFSPAAWVDLDFSSFDALVDLDSFSPGARVDLDFFSFDA